MSMKNTKRLTRQRIIDALQSLEGQAHNAGLRVTALAIKNAKNAAIREVSGQRGLTEADLADSMHAGVGK